MPAWKKMVLHGSSGSLAHLKLENLTSQSTLGTDASGNVVAGSVSGYSLPTATASVLGGVKVGGTLTISSGILNAKAYIGASAAGFGEITEGGAGGDGVAGYVPAATSAQYLSFLRGDGTWQTPTNTVTRLKQSGGTLVAGDFTFAGSGATSISFASGVFTISSTDTDTNTTYTAGTGLTLTGTTFSVTANTFAAASHTHAIRDITDLQTSLDGKQVAGSYAASSHTHDDRYLRLTETSSFFDRVIDSAPGTLDTLNELAAAIGDDANFSASIAGVLARKADSNHGHSDATTSAAGFMSATDKSKLDGVAANANNFSLPTATTSVLGGVKVGTNLSISSGVLSATDTNTVTRVGTSGDDLRAGDIQFRGSGATSITFADGTVTISSTDTDTDTNTTYTAGTGLTLTGTTFSVSANTFAAASHVHTIANVTGLQTALDGKQAVGEYAAASHTHSIRDITDLQTTLDGKQASLGFTPYNATNPSGFITGYTETDTLGTVTNRGNTTSQNIVFSNGRKGLVGVYDAAQTQAIFAMGPAYVLTDGGASGTIGDFYGLGWSYNPGYAGAGNNPQSIAGLNHQLLLMQAGRTTAALGSGIWTSGNIAASNFSGTSSGTNTGDQTNISGNAATATNVAYSGLTGTVPTWNQDTTGNASKLNPLSGDGNYKLAYTADGARNNAGEWGRAVMFYVPNGQTYGIRVDRADFADTATNSNYINSTRDTPSNALQYWQAPGLGLDEAPSGDWHNTIRMGHGSPLSYYSNTLAVRMTGTGVGDIYTQTIMNGTRQGWKKHWNDSNLTNLNQLTNGPGYITSYVNTITSVGISGDLSTGDIDFRAGGATTISKSGGTITISSTDTDTNTTYTAGTGLTLSGTTFSVTSGTYAAASHTHSIGNVTGLQTALDGKQASGDYSVSGHTHSIRDITDLQSSLDGKQASLGFTPYNTTNPSGFITSTSNISGNAATATSAGTLTTNASITGLNFGGVLALVSSGASTSNSTGARMSESYGPYWNLGDGRTWHFQIVNGSLLVGISAGGTNYGSGNIRASGELYAQTDSLVLHAGNFGSYALPLSGGTVTGITYFQTNNGAKSGATDSAKLQAYSTGNNSAFMSFHKAGYFAVNFGLDDDNVMRLGGWSAAANRMQLDMSGNVTFAGNVTGYSDARIKTNVKTIDNALEKVKSLRGVSFTRTDSDDRSTNIGVIAQEVLEILPEVVSQDASGMYNVAYGNIAGLFIEAIKQQQTLIEQQQKQIDQLKALVDGLTK